jgi:hypothetical protein
MFSCLVVKPGEVQKIIQELWKGKTVKGKKKDFTRKRIKKQTRETISRKRKHGQTQETKRSYPTMTQKLTENKANIQMLLEGKRTTKGNTRRSTRHMTDHIGWQTRKRQKSHKSFSKYSINSANLTIDWPRWKKLT